MNKAAQALGRLAAGKPKPGMTSEHRRANAARLAKHRWRGGRPRPKGTR